MNKGRTTKDMVSAPLGEHGHTIFNQVIGWPLKVSESIRASRNGIFLLLKLVISGVDNCALITKLEDVNVAGFFHKRVQRRWKWKIPFSRLEIHFKSWPNSSREGENFMISQNPFMIFTYFHHASKLHSFSFIPCRDEEVLAPFHKGLRDPL